MAGAAAFKILLAICLLQAAAMRVDVGGTILKSLEEGEEELKHGGLASVSIAKSVVLENHKAGNQTLENSQELWPFSKKKDKPDVWKNHKGGWAVGLVNEKETQIFELTENLQTRKERYKATLVSAQDDGGVVTRAAINARVMSLDKHFFTLRSSSTAAFTDENGDKIADYKIRKANIVFSRRYTWRVIRKGGDESILFTIQKRLRQDHCKRLWFWDCRPVLHIYAGRKRKGKTLIYYGVGQRGGSEAEKLGSFDWYHSREGFKKSPHKWVAKINHVKHEGNNKKGDDTYKVEVKAGEDAGLLLLATTCLDKIADKKGRQKEKPDEERPAVLDKLVNGTHPELAANVSSNDTSDLVTVIEDGNTGLRHKMKAEQEKDDEEEDDDKEDEEDEDELANQEDEEEDADDGVMVGNLDDGGHSLKASDNTSESEDVPGPAETVEQAFADEVKGEVVQELKEEVMREVVKGSGREFVDAEESD